LTNPFVTKSHTSGLDYNYQVLFDDADKYTTFYIDADFNHGVNIGFSNQKTHNENQIEIVIGGWTGTRSVIRGEGNQKPLYGNVKKEHTKAEFDEFKHNLQVTVADGIIQVFNGGAEPFMEWESETIVKTELTNMLVSGGHHGSGTWTVKAQKVQPPPPPPRIMYEIYIDGEWQYSIENEQPKVWRNVNAKIANAVGNASQGVYRDFTLTTMNLQEAVESGMTRLQDHFAQILSNSGLSQKAKNKNVKKFNKETNKLIAFYESLRDDDQHPCTFPSTWESKHEADIDHGDPCMATLLVTLAVEEWGKVFVHQCRREKNGGNPLTLLNRVLKKVEKQRIAVDNKLFSDACEAP